MQCTQLYPSFLGRPRLTSLVSGVRIGLRTGYRLPCKLLRGRVQHICWSNVAQNARQYAPISHLHPRRSDVNVL